MSIGENIRKARKNLHMSQEDLAAAIGSNRVTISKYENGDYLPSVPALGRLAEALKTTASVLSGDPEPEQEESNAPKTPEARAVSFGMDSLPKEQRDLILNMLTAMFPQTFDKKGINADDTGL